jgi:competence protein ComEA
MTKRFLFVALLAASCAMAANAVDANRASQAELESVKGIGPALSERILQARREAPFADWADFTARVKGVNAARLAKAGLTVGAAALPASESGR